MTADSKMLASEGIYYIALSFIEKSWQDMHSYKYTDLIKSLPGSSWLVLLTLAVLTERSLPGFTSIKISKFLSNTNTL